MVRGIRPIDGRKADALGLLVLVRGSRWPRRSLLLAMLEQRQRREVAIAIAVVDARRGLMGLLDLRELRLLGLCSGPRSHVRRERRVVMVLKVREHRLGE